MQPMHYFVTLRHEITPQNFAFPSHNTFVFLQRILFLQLVHIGKRIAEFCGTGARSLAAPLFMSDREKALVHRVLSIRIETDVMLQVIVLRWGKAKVKTTALQQAIHSEQMTTPRHRGAGTQIIELTKIQGLMMHVGNLEASFLLPV